MDGYTQLQWVLSHFGQNIGPKKFPSLIVVPHYQLLQGIQGPTEMGESEHFGIVHLGHGPLGQVHWYREQAEEAPLARVLLESETSFPSAIDLQPLSGPSPIGLPALSSAPSLADTSPARQHPPTIDRDRDEVILSFPTWDHISG